VLTPAISGTYTNMRACILVEIKVAITVSRLGNANVLLTCSDIYGWPLIIVRECCAIIRTFLKPQMFEKPTLTQFFLLQWN
jgi:hypothetical protein